VVTDLWVAPVPSAVTETGVSPGRPCSSSATAILPRWACVAVSTSVPGAADAPDQSTSSRASTTVCAEPTGTPA
jgi:hypothetical protein